MKLNVSDIMVLESSVARTASTPAKRRGSVPGPAVRKSINSAMPPSGLAAIACSRSAMVWGDRREVETIQRVPLARWASARKDASAVHSSSV